MDSVYKAHKRRLHACQSAERMKIINEARAFKEGEDTNTCAE